MGFTPMLVTEEAGSRTHVLELRLRPGAVVPGGRFKAGLVRSVEVVAGEAGVGVEGFDWDLLVDDAIDLAPGADPTIWNTGRELAHLRITVSLPEALSEDEVVRLLAAIEAYANLGSRLDRTGRTGDAQVRIALGLELAELADEIRTDVTPEQVMAYAA